MRVRFSAAILLLVGTGMGIPLAHASGSERAAVPTGWSLSQLITPAELVKEMTRSRPHRPVVICVGFMALYRGAHIRGALYEGAASEPSGVPRLRAWARSLPKATPVVIYCGCCPFSECPNVRPAFAVLRNEGMTNVHVLYLERGLTKDWVEKGYPSRREGTSPTDTQPGLHLSTRPDTR
jgi:thiosulfate/3-mercaptopyruvate sulfurtransferase